MQNIPLQTDVLKLLLLQDITYISHRPLWYNSLYLFFEPSYFASGIIYIFFGCRKHPFLDFGFLGYFFDVFAVIAFCWNNKNSAPFSFQLTTTVFMLESMLDV